MTNEPNDSKQEPYVPENWDSAAPSYVTCCTILIIPVIIAVVTTIVVIQL